ncbi:thermonuclease family protein [Chloroflexota bacterium]
MAKRKETVTKVIDGDTIKTSVRKRPVRLQGVDTPEKGEKGYSEAKKALEKLLKDEKVIVTSVATDTFGRTVAKVKKGNALVSNIMKKHQKK